MKTSANLILLTRKRRADGTSPIVLRIIHNRMSMQISTGIYVPAKDWNPDKQSILQTYKGTQSVTRLNNMLNKKRSVATDIILGLEEAGKLAAMDISRLKATIIGNGTPRVSFYTYTEQIISDLISTKRIGTAKIHKGVLAILKKMTGEKELYFDQIDYAFLKRWETAHLMAGGAYNGLGVYLRAVRSVFNSAIKQSVIPEHTYPFKMYKIKTTKTQKRAISVESINALASIELEPGSTLHHARNIFMFSYMCKGMNFTDIALLRTSNIVNGRIDYVRKKTGQPISIKVTESIALILDEYLKGKGDNQYVFDIITKQDPQGVHDQIADARKRFNKRLRLLAKACGIQGKSLTSYVARHSFATRARDIGVGLSEISGMLGHQSLLTTQTYIAGLNNSEEDFLHEKIIKR